MPKIYPKRIYNKKPIPPFPPELNREHFASWLSGFTDGEGSFNVELGKQFNGRFMPSARLTISQRADDVAILRLIHSFSLCRRNLA